MLARRSAAPCCPCRGRSSLSVQAVAMPSGAHAQQLDLSRRAVLGTATGLLLAARSGPAEAITKEMMRRKKKIDLSEYKDGPEGIKYFDLIEGTGAEAKVGARVAVHYSLYFRNITIVTSRQGVGVTGGTPVGFNVGQPYGAPGAAGLPGIDVGVRGMRVGGLRKLHIPPELAYGSKGVAEIPPNSFVDVDVELLSIKQSPIGTRVKLIEG